MRTLTRSRSKTNVPREYSVGSYGFGRAAVEEERPCTENGKSSTAIAYGEPGAHYSEGVRKRGSAVLSEGMARY
eukprot:3784127-Rhodomonas_salina.1